jgi:hypothetical protein
MKCVNDKCKKEITDKIDKEIFKERVIKKWKPILEATNINEEYFYDLALYCNKLQENISGSDLAMSLQLLSRLDMSKVMLVHNEKGCETQSCSIQFSHDQIMDLKFQLGGDPIIMTENAILTELRQMLNKMIDDVGGVIFYKYCGTENDIDTNGRLIGSMLCRSFPVERIRKIQKIKSMMK